MMIIIPTRSLKDAISVSYEYKETRSVTFDPGKHLKYLILGVYGNTLRHLHLR